MAPYVKPLVDCPPGKDLATKIAHALLGWLNMYQCGYLHGGISIGSVLALEHSEERIAFQLTDVFKSSLQGVTMQMLNEKLAHLGLDQSKETLIPDAASWATKLEQLLEMHDIGTTCEAVIIGGDTAKNWQALFGVWGKEKEVSSRERSGTELFMSANILSSDLTDYIQSPIDDIESFVWVTLYAILKNDEPRSSKERKAANFLERGDRGEALNQYFYDYEKVMNDLVKEWSPAVLELGRLYAMLIMAFSKISEKNGWQDEKEEARYWEVAWHGYALQGVCQSLEFILKYINPPTI